MELNRRASLGGLLALTAGSAAAAAKVGAAKAAGPWSKVRATANKVVAERLTPGLQVCVMRHGRVVFSEGFGKADLEWGMPMTPTSICRIGSVSKQFTAAAVLLLAQDGKLSLDDRLSRFFPDFPNAGRLPLRRMLSHTAGLGNYTATTPPERVWQEARVDRSSAEMLDLMRPSSTTLIFEPGTDYRYSNTGFVLLGLVIENASFTSMTYPGGAGAIRSTCEDLCAWHAALLGGKVLQPAMLKAMLTPVTLNDGALPMQKNRKGEPTAVRYGFGIGVGPIDGHRAAAHGGNIQGFASNLETLQDDGVTIAMMINADGGSAPTPAFLAAPGEIQKALRAAGLAA